MRIILFSLATSMVCHISHQSQCKKSHLPELHTRVVSPYNQESNQEKFYLVGFFPAMLKRSSIFNLSGFVWIEVAKFAFMEVIEMYHKLGLNINLELLIYDTCNQINIASMQLVNLLLHDPVRPNVNSSACCSNKDSSNNIIGIIGPASSSVVDQLLKLTSFDNYPLISYSATSVRFDNKMLYPTFSRTIPPDNLQARLMLDLVLKYKWNYVSIVAQDNEYGRMGTNELQDIFEANQICTSIELVFDHKDKASLKSVVEQIKRDTFVNVIVVWASGLGTQSFLEAAMRYKLYSKTFILGESANENPDYLKYEPKVVHGMLSVVPDGGVYNKFEEYFKKQTYKDNKLHDPWMKTFFEKFGDKVDFRKHSIKDYWELLPMVKNGNVYNSIFAYGFAIKKFIMQNPGLCSWNTTSDCLKTVVHDRQNFFEKYLRNGVFYDLKNRPTTFDREGNMNSTQFIISSPQFDNGVLKWKRIGKWNHKTGVQIFSNFTWVDNQTSPPASHCGTKCAPGFERHNSSKTCCWMCLPCQGNTVKFAVGDELCTECPFGTYRNKKHTHCLPLRKTYFEFESTVGIVLLTFAFFNTFIVILFTIVFITFRKTPVVISSQLTISLLQFFFLVLINLTSYTSLGEPNQQKCQVNAYLMPFVIVLTITPTIMKTRRYLTVFTAKRILSRNRYTRSSAIFQVLFLLVVQGVLIFIANSYEAFNTVSIMDVENLELHLSCSHSILYYLEAVYVIILLLICGISAFKARNLPNNYNETRMISYTMFLCCVIVVFLFPLYVSYENEGTKDIVVSFGIISVGFTIIMFMYSHKIWIIIFCPDLNTVENFTMSRMRKINKDITTHFTKRSPGLSPRSDETSCQNSPMAFYKGRSLTFISDISTESTPQNTPSASHF